MIRSKLITTVAAAALMAAAPLAAGTLPLLGTSAAQAQSVSLSFNLFFDELEPHGVWVRHSRYRYVWCPTVSTRWEPYTRGSWVYLRDHGWYFQSSEPYAWAVYHYGRWYDDADLGWCWVPGTQWAPAWVSWRRTSDYVGWAPLPPQEDGFQISFEISVGNIEPDNWFFVPVRQFTRPNLSIDIVFGNERPALYERSEFLGTVVYEDNRIYNTSLDITYIEQNVEQNVTIYNTTTVNNYNELAAQPAGDTIKILAANIEEPTEEVAPPEAVEPEEAQQRLAEERPAEDAPMEGDQPAEDAAMEDDDATTEVEAEGTASETEVTTTEGEETTTEGEETTTEGEKTVVEGETDVEAGAAVEGEVTVEDCLEDEKFVEGKCVPVTTDEAQDETPVQSDEATEAQQQEGTEATEPAQATEPAPATEPAQPAEPAAQPAEPAQATEPAPAAEEVAPEPAPAPEEAVPAEEPAGPTEADCLAQGLQLIDGVCVPVEAAPAQEEAPAQ